MVLGAKRSVKKNRNGGKVLQIVAQNLDRAPQIPYVTISVPGHPDIWNTSVYSSSSRDLAPSFNAPHHFTWDRSLKGHFTRNSDAVVKE